MRARLMMKIVGMIVMLALSGLAAHSCNSGPASSPLNPSNVVKNGVAGICAEQAATAAAAGSDSTPSVQIPAGDSNLMNMAKAAGISPGSFSCPTTTVAGAP